MTEQHRSKHRSRRRKKNKTKKILIVILLILILSAIGLGVWFFLLNNDAPTEFSEPTASAETEKTEDTIAIPGYEGLTLIADSKKQELSLKNPETNTCYFVITLYLEDGTELWKSEMLKAGDISKPIKLNRELSAGNYPAKLKYECYRMDKEKTPLNGAEMKLTLRVK